MVLVFIDNDMEAGNIMVYDKISIIVPIYKVEDYLDRCISSIVNQTYKNIEIILVDDGSPDQCPNICDEWTKKDNRIIVVHKANGGLSDARNTGLNIATGEYIGFVDSDDFISKDMYQVLYNVLIDTNSDIVQCEYIKFTDDSLINDNQPDCIINEYNVEEALFSLINENPLKQVVWNKLYKRRLFDDIRFEKNKLNEDEFFTYQIFAKANKISYINQALYYYFSRETSIMGKPFSSKRLDGLEARMKQYQFFQENYNQLVSYQKKNLWFYIIYLVQNIYQIEDMGIRKNLYDKIYYYYKIIRYDEYLLPKLSFKESMWILLSKISLSLTAYLRNFLKLY